MARAIAVVGAASSIGIRPYDNGEMRELDRAPDALREQGLITRLSARDLGNIAPPPYQDFERPPGKARNEEGLVTYSRRLAASVQAASEDGAFVLLLGGDCSIVLGGLLGVQRQAPVGLIYIDAHADFATPEESRTGSAASMCLGLAVGRGNSPLARLTQSGTLVSGKNAVIIGRRDYAEAWYGQDALEQKGLLDIHHRTVREQGCANVARIALDRATRPGLGGFWIHLDADVIDPSQIPAVDSPEPDGLLLEEVAELLRTFAAHPKALGLELTIYDPKLDPERTSAFRLVALLERVLGSGNLG